MKVTSIRIRGYHCDAYGHVNNARFLELLEEARWKFLEPAVRERFFETEKLLFVVVNINIAFKRPLLPHQLIHIHIKDLTYNNRSVSMIQEIIDDRSSVVCSRAEIQFVLLDSITQKPVPISDEIKAKLEQLLSDD